MRFRKLRIAWSVAWSVLAVVFCLAWFVSCLKLTSIEVLVTPTHRYYIHSLAGTLSLEREYREFIRVEIRTLHTYEDSIYLATKAGIKIVRSTSGEVDAVSVSYWLLTCIAMFVAAIPWFSWRFSLRTLLIATTLVAVGLGLAVYANS
jgi:hypothetical protein